MLEPKVSCILTTHDGRRDMCKRAIQSILAQTFMDFELLIIDDASQDGTDEMIKSFEDNRICYLKRKENFGSDTRPKNEGLLASKGKYIAYLDSDNSWHPYHLEKLLERIENNPELDLVYCDMWIYDETRPTWPGMMGVNIPAFDAQFLLNRCYIDTSSVLHKRDLAFAVGGFDESLPKFIDWNMWVRMCKWGAVMERVPVIATNYYMHPGQKSNRIKSRSWDDERIGMTMYEPIGWSASGCYIYLPHLRNDREEEKSPRVAIYTLSYDRLEYTKRMAESLKKSTAYPFDWFVLDQGSQDGSADWLEKNTTAHLVRSDTNLGISGGSNRLLDEIEKAGTYQLIGKVDNDCVFLTFGWLETLIDLWKRNHMVYMTPYPEGLVDNPGGAPRVGYSFIGPYFLEVSHHLSGLCAFVDARAYKGFRWSDRFLHGNQDREASVTFSKKRFMPSYIPLHRVQHMDTTAGQHKKYPAYFERRVMEKRTQL